MRPVVDPTSYKVHQYVRVDGDDRPWRIHSAHSYVGPCGDIVHWFTLCLPHGAQLTAMADDIQPL